MLFLPYIIFNRYFIFILTYYKSEILSVCLLRFHDNIAKPIYMVFCMEIVKYPGSNINYIIFQEPTFKRLK